MKRLLLFAMILGATACDREPEGVPEEVREERRSASQRACLTEELARAAEEDLQTLEESFASVGEGPTAALTRQAAQSATTYARAYLQHALLREAAAARADSALNHSVRQADSLRHARQADQFVISAPDPGSIEANVIQEYERRYARLRADQDHPCNWDLDG